MKALLPVGSVVGIKDFDKLYVVCSADKENGEYILATYPSGITPLFLARKEKKENIKEVYFLGYMDNASLLELVIESKEEK